MDEHKDENIQVLTRRKVGFNCENLSLPNELILKISKVPEYKYALRYHDGAIDNEKLYEIVQDAYAKMVQQGYARSIAKDILNSLCFIMTGKKFYKKEGLTNNQSKYWRLLRSKTNLNKHCIYNLLFIKEFVDILDDIRTKKKIEDDDIYEAAKKVFFPRLKEFNSVENFKDWYVETYGREAYRTCSYLYTKTREAVRTFAKELSRDWQQEYEEWLKERD